MVKESMDVEKTIQFLLSAQAGFAASQADFAARQIAADARLTRIEALTASNAEDIKGLAVKLGELAQMSFEADRKLGQRIEELDSKLGQRIDNLVSGIGEFMRRDVPPYTQ